MPPHAEGEAHPQAPGLAGLRSPWAMRRVVAILVLLCGLMLSLAVPGHHVAFAWVVTFVPLFLALDLMLRGSATGGWGRWLKVLACCWPVGVVMGLVTGDWVVNTSYVFGGLPLWFAYCVSALGYGSLMGLEVFIFLGAPFALAWGSPRITLFLVPLWATVLQVYVPRFLFWTYGQLMFPAAALVQVADIVGSGGLNLWLLPLHLLLYGWLRRAYAPEELGRRWLAWSSAVLLLAFGLSWGYGQWRMQALAGSAATDSRVQLVGLQPNFSLKSLASNPDLSPSDRTESLGALISDSDAALARGVVPGIPIVVVWPESVYPAPYLEARPLREVVERWVRTLGVHLVLASQDDRFRREPDGSVTWLPYGAAIHVSPGGSPPEVYHKITLIPFGETIPFAGTVPVLGRLLRTWVPRMSQFAAGDEPTVFSIALGVRIAPMICFDATNYHVAQGMAYNGANVGLVLANLAWFGSSTASVQFERFVRFRAIENRIPILMLSQNGQSVLIDNMGRAASPHLGLFKVGALSVEVPLGPGGSPFTRYGAWIQGLYALLLAGVLLAWWRRPRRSTTPG